MSYRIITDSCCDLPENMYGELDLSMIPLTLNFRGQEHTDLSEGFMKELYAGLRAGEVASTAAVNPDGWANIIEPVLAAGEDADFGKTLTGCQKIEAAPFYAVPIYPMPYQTYGGIAVDVDGHVLSADGAVMPGLYAAGICTGSFAAQAGLFYLGGVSQSLAFGRQAGKNAAAEEAWA